MTYEQNLKAILDSHLTEIKDEIKDSIIDSILRLKTAGKWIPQKGGGFCCSNCKSYSLHEIDGNYIHVSARTKYCHNCGAKMTEDKT